MTFEPKSIAEQIECLSRLTGAPDSFVSQVKSLFSRKGIPLDSDSTPYLKALEEAFNREETIRSTVGRAQHNVSQLQQRFEQLGRSYSDQAEQLKRIRSGLDPARGSDRGRVERASRVRIVQRGAKRHLVTPTQREIMPMVPGPKEVQ